MADIAAVRTALAAQITAKTGLRTMAEARDSISPPVAIVLPGQPLATFGATQDGALTINLVVLIVISDAPTSERTQRTLDSYLGIGGNQAASIPNAIMSDPSLGGAVHFAEPMTITNYGRIDYGGEGYFGARLQVQVGAV